nr:MAG TPA: Dynactin subunit 1 Protein [Caudoviricetes sp.]
MSELKIGNRVKVISDPKFIEFTGEKSIIGMTGTVKELDETCVGVEFDDYVGDHYGNWNGKSGYCWYIPYERLEKIEEIKAEPKAETLEQKILMALREEIGVDIGEKFDLYENGEKQWTCKFEGTGFFCEIDDEFYKSEIWKNIAYNFCRYTFKRIPFIPRYSEEYFYLYTGNLSGEPLFDEVELRRWVSSDFDHGMLALGNVFRTREEALNSRDKLIERLNELLKEE